MGQATASVASFCPMVMDANDSIEESGASSNVSHGKMTSMRNMDMKDMDMHELMMQDMSMTKDCCSQAEHCSMANCAIPGISADYQLNIPKIILHSISVEYLSLPRKSTTSLYRPPIFA